MHVIIKLVLAWFGKSVISKNLCEGYCGLLRRSTSFRVIKIHNVNSESLSIVRITN